MAALLLGATAAFGADAPQNGVSVYEPAFFADARPNTAYDMIGRLPGFSFTNTGSARGFAGTAGNVLIDGQRPTSKSDDLASILTRIPAADVERIEVIRGGAPGIDMQGQTTIANVIRKKGSSTQWVVDATENIFKDGHTVPGLTVNFTEHDGDKTFEASASRYNSFDDSVGDGTHTVVNYDKDGNVEHLPAEGAHLRRGQRRRLHGGRDASDVGRHVQGQPGASGQPVLFDRDLFRGAEHAIPHRRLRRPQPRARPALERQVRQPRGRDAGARARRILEGRKQLQ